MSRLTKKMKTIDAYDVSDEIKDDQYEKWKDDCQYKLGQVEDMMDGYGIPDLPSLNLILAEYFTGIRPKDWEKRFDRPEEAKR